MYKALSVADYIINYCDSHDRVITNLKLQNLLYLVQAEFLVGTKDHRPCFSDTIGAWDFGVIIPDVHYQYKVFGNGMIIPNKNDVLKPYYDKITEEDKERIDSVCKDIVGCYSDTELRKLVCGQTPWKEAYGKGIFKEISNESIYEYFKRG